MLQAHVDEIATIDTISVRYFYIYISYMQLFETDFSFAFIRQMSY